MNPVKSLPVSRLLLWGMMLLAFPALATDVVFNLSDARLGIGLATNRTVWIQGLAPNASGGTIIIGAKIITNSGASGSFTLTNLYGSTNSGLYYCTVQAPPQQTAFKILVTGTNLGTIYAADILVADASSTFPAGSVAWAAAVTDLRYAPSTNANVYTFVTATTATNIAAYQAFLATNNYAPTVTNIVNALGGSGVTATNLSGGALTQVTNIASTVTNGFIKNSFTTNTESASRLVVTNIVNAVGDVNYLKRNGASGTNLTLLADQPDNSGIAILWGTPNGIAGGVLGTGVIYGNGAGITNLNIGATTNVGTLGYSNTAQFLPLVTNIAQATQYPVASITNAGPLAYSNTMFVSNVAYATTIPVAQVTNAGNMAYSNTTQFLPLATNIALRASQDATNKLDTDLRAAIVGSTNLYIRNSFDTNTDAAAKGIVTNIVLALSGAVTNSVWATNAADGSITNTGQSVKLTTDLNANTKSLTNQGPSTYSTLVLERNANHSGNSGYSSTVLEVFGGAANSIAGSANTANNTLIGGIGNRFSVGSVAASGNVMLQGSTNSMDDDGPVTAFKDSAVIAGEYLRLGGASASYVLGSRATNAGFDGAFVWNSRQAGGFSAGTSNAFLLNSQNGVAINTNNPSGKALKVIGDSASDATTIGINPVFAGTTNVISATGFGSAAANGTFVWTSGALMTNYATAAYITNNAGTRQIKSSAGAVLYTSTTLTNGTWSISSGSAPGGATIYGETLNLNGLHFNGAFSSTNLDQRLASITNAGISSSTALRMIQTNAITATPSWYWMSSLGALGGSNQFERLYISDDGITWTATTNGINYRDPDFYTNAANGPISTEFSVLPWNNAFYACYNYDPYNTNLNAQALGIARSYDMTNWARIGLVRPWTNQVGAAVFAATWFVDDDASVYLIGAYRAGDFGLFKDLFSIKSLDGSMTNFAAPVAILSNTAAAYDGMVLRDHGTYKLWAVSSTGNNGILLATNSNITSLFTVVTNEIYFGSTGSGTFIPEAPNIVRSNRWNWRMYVRNTDTNGMMYADSTDGGVTWGVPHGLLPAGSTNWHAPGIIHILDKPNADSSPAFGLQPVPPPFNPVASNSYNGTFTGNGAGLTNLSVASPTFNANQFDSDGSTTNIKSGALVTNLVLKISAGGSTTIAHPSGSAILQVAEASGQIAAVNDGWFNGGFGTLSGTNLYVSGLSNYFAGAVNITSNLSVTGNLTSQGVPVVTNNFSISQTNLSNVTWSNSTIANGVYVHWNGTTLLISNAAVSTQGVKYGPSGLTNANNAAGYIAVGAQITVNQLEAKDYLQGDNAVFVGAAGDAGISRVAAGVSRFNANGSGSTVGNFQWAGEAYLATNMTMNTTTLSNINWGTTISVTTGRKYTFKAILFVSDALAADGVKIDFGGGTASETDFRAQVTAFDSALALSTHLDDITDTASAATFTGNGMLEIHGSFEPGSTGTFIPRFAKASDTAGAVLTLYRGSHITVFDSP